MSATLYTTIFYEMKGSLWATMLRRVHCVVCNQNLSGWICRSICFFCGNKNFDFLFSISCNTRQSVMFWCSGTYQIILNHKLQFKFFNYLSIYSELLTTMAEESKTTSALYENIERKGSNR